jgi:hypothetical protein
MNPKRWHAMKDTTLTSQGVVVGMLLGFASDAPLVVFPGNPSNSAIRARSTVSLGSEDIGKEVAILFEDGAADRPLVIGRILRSAEPEEALREAVVRLDALERIELRVGKAAIILEADGHVTIRGSNIVSQASGANAVRGGSVKLN